MSLFKSYGWGIAALALGMSAASFDADIIRGIRFSSDPPKSRHGGAKAHRRWRKAKASGRR